MGPSSASASLIISHISPFNLTHTNMSNSPNNWLIKIDSIIITVTLFESLDEFKFRLNVGKVPRHGNKLLLSGPSNDDIVS